MVSAGIGHAYGANVDMGVPDWLAGITACTTPLAKMCSYSQLAIRPHWPNWPH